MRSKDSLNPFGVLRKVPDVFGDTVVGTNKETRMEEGEVEPHIWGS